MKKVMPAGPVFQAGTLSGNPLAMAAGIATLSELKANPPYARLDELERRLGDGLAEGGRRRAGVPVQFNRVGSMWTLFFTADAGDRLRHREDRATRRGSPGSSGR